MSQYKYPIRYFCAPDLTRFTREYVYEGLQLLDKNHAIKTPITGETGIDGLLIDFNRGLRLQVPRGRWHVRIADSESEVIFFDDDVAGVTLISMEKFYIEWEIAVWLDNEPVFYHQFDPTGQKIHFNFTRPILGDNLALLPYVEEFRRTFECEVTLKIPAPFHEIIRQYYPHFTLVDEVPDDSYACFYMAAWVRTPVASTCDMRALPLEMVGHTILATSKIPQPSKKIFTPTKPRAIEQKYVCIGVQSSATTKTWLNPGGWDHVVDYLKSLGYRVLCIDRDRKCSNLGLTVEMPKGAEDFSGDYTLIDRVNQLAYADFFIGLGSGLSWLAWSIDIPVILISGISEPWCEFASAYRVHNPLVCHGCYNDLRVALQKCLECPRFKDTDPERAFECSKKISARMVINTIDRLIAAPKSEAHHEHL